ncbi:hypothetical protein C8N46_11210 [Kordia periserrulae]|uniref:Lipoprotein n=1 Tax=Kordia periserrulae TaxID=701523 RepID=A0A2T6BRM4_9FLAO|nr:hypothetical protein [Kordia periserrulae]PTX58702.1 hypothetical protein C8N46_11210 [Kordia periserrulae]
MKKIFLGLLVAVATLTSCEFSETIYINEDGSGKMSMYLDASELMPMMKSQIPAEMKSLDSLISFKEVFAGQQKYINQLPKRDQELIQGLAKLNFHVVLDSDKDKLNTDMYMNFSSINDVQNAFDGLSSIGKLAQNRMTQGSISSLSDVNSDDILTAEYSLKKNKFRRFIRIVDTKLMDSLRTNLGQMQMILASSTYKLNYKFPKKVKSVSLEDAVIGKDGKSVTVTVNALDFVNDPEILNVEVELEK